jgi:bacteriocin-like protein
MAEQKSDKTDKTAKPIPSADTLIKPSKDAEVELTEDDLAKVTGGVKTISWDT